MNFLSNKILIWVIAGSVSLILLLIILSQLDLNILAKTIDNANINVLLLAILFLLLEGIATSYRILHLSSNTLEMKHAIYANSWYALYVAFLPARLGEIAGIYVLKKHMQQKQGAALGSIITQRLFDLIVLATLFLIAIIFSTDLLPKTISILSGITLIAISATILMKCEKIFSLIAATSIKFKHPKTSRLTKLVFRTAIQARTWNKTQAINIKIIIFSTTLKWIFNLTAITCILISTNVSLNTDIIYIISALYNFIAVIPIQTIGGIGIGEAGLTLMLNGAGISLQESVAISLYARAVILIFPFLFLLIGTLNFHRLNLIKNING